MTEKTELFLRKTQSVIVKVLAVCVVLMLICCCSLFIFYIDEPNALYIGAIMLIMSITSIFMVKTMWQKTKLDLEEIKNRKNNN
jgi:Kef-type K+ transport system membrane component KefB